MLCWSFVSVPPGSSPHDAITLRAARMAGWPRRGERALLEAVRAPDLGELRLSPCAGNLRRVRARAAYDPAHHLDRVPPISDAEAFRHGRAHVSQQRALAEALAHDPAEAVRALGRALHAVQDAWSHSNAVDLDDAGRRRFIEALVGDGPVPKEVRLVSFLPGIREPGLPDDPYPHDRFCKDATDATDEARQPHRLGTKFDAAREAATEASAEVIRAFLRNTGLQGELARLDGRHTVSRTVLAAGAGLAVLLGVGAAGWLLGALGPGRR